jgi:Leucine-rich repeat (LRR) protein
VFFLRLNHQTRFLRVKNVVFFSPGNLKYISFFNNKIKEINPKLLNGLTNLEEINFDNNQIKNISSYLFNGLSKLRKINFCNNLIIFNIFFLI